jgi:hypothetical protein
MHSGAISVIWALAEATAANTLYAILGRRPLVFEVRRMCEICAWPEHDLALFPIWLSAVACLDPAV